MATNMLTNRKDVEKSISDEMFDDAIKFGQLGGSRFGAMTASTYGQAAMQGRAIGGMLGGQDPRMAKQDLIDELMSKHQNPSTKKELLAVAEDAATLGLYDIQGQFLDIASQVPDKKMANDSDFTFLINHMGITESSTEMLHSYIKSLNPQGKMSNKDYMTAVESLTPDAKNEFNTILNGYGSYLATKGLTPTDIQDMAFTNEGRKKNIALFKAYLSPIKDANTVALWLFNNNQILEPAPNGNDNNGNDNGIVIKSDIKITGRDTLVSIEQKNKGSKLDFHSESKVNQKLIKARSDMRLMMNLEWQYSLLMKMNIAAPTADAFGSVGELFMDKETKDYANQLDAVKDWMGGEIGTRVRRSSAMQHFQSNPPEALQEFIADPVKYYKEKILISEYYNAGKDGELGTSDDILINPETEIPSLWGLGN